MIAYQPMNTDAPTVSKHGSTFNEAEERQQQYPFQLCPECLSEHTEVVELLDSDYYGCDKHTGSKCRIGEGIFEHQCERVNYICEDCCCEFYQLYRTGEKGSVEVNDSVAWTIIGFILTALSLFVLITSMSVDDPSVLVMVVSCLSGTSLAIFGDATLVALEEIFGQFST